MIPAHLRQTITDLTAPTGLPGWCTAHKAAHLVELILEHKPRLIVELGVFGGRSFIPMVLALRENRTGGLAVGIDPWTVEAATDGMDLHDADDQRHVDYWSKVPLAMVHQRCLEVMNGQKLWDLGAVLQARSENVVQLFHGIDFLHIDGNHTELASCRDVGLWLPRCRPGAIVAFDDTDWPSTQKALALMADWCVLLEDRTQYRIYQKRDIQ